MFLSFFLNFVTGGDHRSRYTTKAQLAYIGITSHEHGTSLIQNGHGTSRKANKAERLRHHLILIFLSRGIYLLIIYNGGIRSPM
jgi:hypothetical protein